MRRKVVKHGSATLTISLPAKWVQRNNIKSWDELEIFDKHNSLTILSESAMPSEKKVIDLTGMPKRMIDCAVTSSYTKGYDELELIHGETGITETLNKLSYALLGYEVFYCSEKRCLIKSISSAQPTEFESIMRKNFHVIMMLANESLELIKKKKYSKLNDIVMLEKTNNKFTNYLLRVISVKGFKSRQHDFFLHTMIRLLERVADSYRDICQYLAAQEPGAIRISSETLGIYEAINRMMDRYSATYFSNSIAEASIIATTLAELQDKIRQMRKSPKNIHEMAVVNCLAGLVHELDTLLYELAGYLI